MQGPSLSLLLNRGDLPNGCLLAGESLSVSLWLQVPFGGELAFAIANFKAEDGSGLPDRWPIALELSECTYVTSDREFQLWPELGQLSKCRAIRHCG